MKKLLLFFVFLLSFICRAQASEDLAIKIGRKMIVFQIENLTTTNHWGEQIIIKQQEIILPSDDYLEKSNVPKTEWEVFTESKNGVYYSLLEKNQKEKETLLKEREVLLQKIKTKNYLLISVTIFSLASLLALIFISRLLLRKNNLFSKNNFRERN